MNRYDDRARLVFHYAREEGNKLGHAMVGPEHLLLGLMCEAGTAAQILQGFGGSLEGLRHKVEEIIGRGEGSRLNDAPSITPSARRVMELSAAEARSLGAEVTSTEHILLGIIREGDGVAYRILQGLTPDVDVIRWRVLANSSDEQVSRLREQGGAVKYPPLPDPDLESRVERLEQSVDTVARTFSETVNEIYQAATRDKPEPSSATVPEQVRPNLESSVVWTSMEFIAKPKPSSQPNVPDPSIPSALPSASPRENRALEYRKNWLTHAPIGLTLFGLGLSITLEANNHKNAREPYFWLGTLGLIILSAGLAFLGDAVKSRVLLELESRPRQTSS